jgi:hypothetical protein
VGCFVVVFSQSEMFVGPFLVRCYHIFEDSEKLYFVMECASGGELFVHLSREKVFFFCCFGLFFPLIAIRFLIRNEFGSMLQKCFWDWSKNEKMDSDVIRFISFCFFQVFAQFGHCL